MPEIKNTFTSGKMNKDLDERLVKNGEYRDAMNVDVSASTTDNVGSVHNSFGNVRKDTTSIVGGFCVGSCVDKQSQTVIWFISGTTYDAITQYDPSSQVSFPILVSKKEGQDGAFLKFNNNRLITAINVMDGFLYWTDGYSEPKKANIARCRSGVASSNPWSTPTKFKRKNGTISGDILEKHLTIIKRYPVSAPDIVLSNSSRDGLSLSSVTIPTNTSFVDNDFGDGSNDKLSNIYTRGSGTRIIPYQDISLIVDSAVTASYNSTTITIRTSGAWDEYLWQSISSDWYFTASSTGGTANTKYEQVTSIDYAAHTITVANGVNVNIDAGQTIVFTAFTEAYNNYSFFTYKNSAGDVTLKPPGTSSTSTQVKDGGVLGDGSGVNIVVDSSNVTGTGYAQGANSRTFTLTTGGSGYISSGGVVFPGLLKGHTYKIVLKVSNYSGSGDIGLASDVGANVGQCARRSGDGTVEYKFKPTTLAIYNQLKLTKASTAAGSVKVSIICLSGPKDVKIQEMVFDGQPDYKTGDIVKLTIEDKGSNDYLAEELVQEIRVKLGEQNNDLSGITARTTSSGSIAAYGGTGSNGERKVFNVEIIQATSGVQNLTPSLATGPWVVEREKGDPLFANSFPRFAYRWRYLDNEQSAISAFTEAAFLPKDEEYSYDSEAGFNVVMENDVRNITLKNFQPTPEDVIELDILYTESDNTNIYIIKTFKNTELSNLVEYDITSDLLQGVIPSNQILRPYDNVPRKAVAQEITGNRLIYGNYTQQYNVDENLKVLVLPVKKEITDSKAKKSIKSIRNYQIGVCLLDKYGRQTPVFSSDEGIIDLNQQESDNTTTFEAEVKSKTPSWATHYKYFVKDNSSEYYNLAMDRFYSAEADEHVWLSFPSSDSSKVSVDDFIILKKQHDNQLRLKNQESLKTAKYKVLAKENSAPDYIKFKKVSLGKSENLNFATNSSVTSGYPLEGSISFTVRASEMAQFIDTFPEDVGTKLTDNKFIKLGSSVTGVSSAFYEIDSVTWSNTALKAGVVYYTIKLKEPLGKDASLTRTSPGSSTRGIYVEFFERKEFNDLVEFEGRFFIKVLKDDILSDNVLKSQASNAYIVKNSQQFHWAHAYVRNSVQETDGTWPTNGTITSSLVDGTVTLLPSSDYRSTYLKNKSSFTWNTALVSTDSSVYDSTLLLYNAGSTIPPSPSGTGVGRFISGTVDFTDFYLGPDTQGWLIDSAWGWQMGDDEFYLHANGQGPGDPAVDGEDLNYNMGDGFIPGNDHCDFRIVGLGAGSTANHNKTSTGYEWPVQNKDLANYALYKELMKVGTKFRWRDDPGVSASAPSTIYTVMAAEAIDFLNVTTKWKTSNSNFDKPTNKGIRIHLKLDKKITWSPSDPTSVDDDNVSVSIKPLNGNSGRRAISNTSTLEILEIDPTQNTFSTDEPAIFETEPKERADLNLYYETPVSELIIKNGLGISTTYIDPSTGVSALFADATISTVRGWSSSAFQVDQNQLSCSIPAGNSITIFKKDTNGVIEFNFTFTLSVSIAKFLGATKSDGVWGRGSAGSIAQILQLPKTDLKWHNCFAFGNGVESNRIRDDFNAVTIDKGPKVSATIDEVYKEEVRQNSLIYSGLYNNNSSVNNINQFIQAEKITKDLNPEYGGIQKLFSRNTNIVAFCENKIIKILANKDALFNADGNTNLVSTNRVLGQSVPFLGEFGISRNPESFANYGYRIYFTDKDRNAVLRLSEDGLTDISKTGMSTYFRDSFKTATTLIGSYDEDKRNYNLTMSTETVSFSEDVKGWTSRKSFIPESGLSMDNGYYTFKTGRMWLHGENELRNNFYAVQYADGSSVDFILNLSPSVVKTFKTLNYEGTIGWTANTIETDLMSGKVLEFVEKEGLWFNYIKGIATTATNLDSKQFSTQGLSIIPASGIDLNGYTPSFPVQLQVKLITPEDRYVVNQSATNSNNEDLFDIRILQPATLSYNIIFYVHSKIVNGQKWSVKAANFTATLGTTYPTGSPVTFGTATIVDTGVAGTYENTVKITVAVAGTMTAAATGNIMALTGSAKLTQN